MPLPLPKIVPDAGPGGYVADILNRLEDLKSKHLANQYFEPSQKADIGYKNALLQAQNIKNQYLPKNLEEELKKQQLANFLYLPNTQSLINYRNARVQEIPFSIQEKMARVPLMRQQAARLNLMNNNPLLFKGGISGDLGALDYLSQIPGKENAANLIRENLYSNLDIKNKKAKLFNYNAMPSEYKSDELANFAGMGIRAPDAIKNLESGIDSKTYAKLNNIDMNSIEPIYPLTTQGRNQITQRNVAQNELNVLDKNVSKALAPYSRTVMGYSPKMVAKMALNYDPDSIGKYLAGRALQPELAAIRMRMAQGQVGIEAIREFTEKALGNAKIFQSNVSPEAYEKMQYYINDWLKQAVSAANTRAYGKGGFSNPIPRSSQESVYVYDPKTKKVMRA